jgi:hypothetical protein
MRMLMTIRMNTDATNVAIRDGSMAKTIRTMLDDLHAEAAYFTTQDGIRTTFVVFDMADSAQMPVIAEPFFIGMSAQVDFTPVMNVDDLSEGLQNLAAMR